MNYKMDLIIMRLSLNNYTFSHNYLKIDFGIL